MSFESVLAEWTVTPEKVQEAVRRIVAAADPLQVILFGSRGRGDHRPHSDLDLAVIIDTTDEEARRRLPYTVITGLRMEVTLIVVSKTKYDLHRTCRNSVFRNIDREGVVLYERNNPQSAHRYAA